MNYTLTKFKPSEIVGAVMTFNSDKKKLIELLGTCFFINSAGIALTAKHIFDDYDPKKLELSVVLIDRNDKIFVFKAEVYHKSQDFDIAAIKVNNFRSPFLAVEDKPLYNNYDYLTVEYSETAFELDEVSGHKNIYFKPSTRKGNIVKSYVSKWPEKKPTRIIEVSFPVLQGASGAPLMENLPISIDKPQSWDIVGMIVQNIEYDLQPAQTISLKEGRKFSEETKYFLPVGKAIRSSHLIDFIHELEKFSK